MTCPTPQQLEAVTARWGLDPALTFLRRVENFVYEGRDGNRAVIVRLTEPSHRDASEIEAEVHWMDHLGQCGLRLARPVPSRTGRLVALVDGESRFIATVFTKAPGRALASPEEVTPAMLRAWGGYLGRMHALTRDYRPPPHIPPRRDWDQDDGLRVALRGLDPADGVPHDRFRELLAWLRDLPRDPASYGLAHCDLHHGNFFVEHGEITAFDFDDCCHHWFAYDVIVPFFTTLGWMEESGRPAALAPLLEPFLEGYRGEHPMEPMWESRLPEFLRFRSALLFHWIKVRTAEGRFTGKALEWCARATTRCLRTLAEPPG